MVSARLSPLSFSLSLRFWFLLRLVSQLCPSSLASGCSVLVLPLRLGSWSGCQLTLATLWPGADCARGFPPP